MGENHFRLISSAATRERDKFHIKKYLSKEVELKDVTDEFCVFGLFGPNSRSLMQKLSETDFSNKNFKFATSKNIKINEINVWVQRLSYVGELGYELYVRNSEARDIYEQIIKKGKNLNISNCGMHALDTMRMESGFLHWGHDISPEENQYQANLVFTISKKKQINFIGKEAIEKIKNRKQEKRFAMFTLNSSEPGKPLILHDEPIYLSDKIIGRTTSGNYSFNYKKNLAFGYINNLFSDNELREKELYIEIEKKKYLVKLLFKPLKNTKFKNI